MSWIKTSMKKYNQVAIFILFLALSAPAYSETQGHSEQAFLWGVVGHNDRPDRGRSYPYNFFSVSEQMDMAQAAGLNAYRAGCRAETCEKLIEETEKRGMVFLRSIEMRPDAKLTPEENYRRGYNHGFKEAQNYAGRIKYYEASNELDNWTKMVGDGSHKVMYNPFRYKMAREFLRGLVDGIHAGDKEARVLIDNAGWCHYGFLKALWADGVRWDITAFHWYSDQGNIERAGCQAANIAEIHASFGKPVWITEYNYRPKKDGYDQEEAEKWVAAFINQIKTIAPKYNIQAAFIYELFDEPDERGNEKYYGIIKEGGERKKTWHAIGKTLTD